MVRQENCSGAAIACKYRGGGGGGGDPTPGGGGGMEAPTEGDDRELLGVGEDM